VLISKQIIKDFNIQCNQWLIDWFDDTYGDQELDIYSVIADLDRNKTKHIACALFREFILDGICQDWHDNGERAVYFEAINGVPEIRMVSWHANGKLQCISNYRRGVMHGLTSQWYEDGKRWYTALYKNGDRHGDKYEWHENGRLRSYSTYIDGKDEGYGVCYYPDGKVVFEGKYENGVMCNVF